MKKLTKALIGTAAAAGAVSFGAGYIIFNEVMNRDALIYPKIADSAYKKMDHVDVAEEDERLTWYKNQEPQYFEMINPRNFRLKAKYIPADKPSKKYVFCSHGYRSTGNGEFKLMAKFYHDMGINLFIVDHQAAGESDGKYIGFGYHESKDCILWLKWMLEKFGDDIEIILHGVSMGCATVLMMSGDPDLPSNVKFVVADCGYTSAYDEFEHILSTAMHLPNFPILYTSNFFNKLLNGWDFKDADPINRVHCAKVPIMFIHGGNDDFVPTYMVHQLYAACESEYKDLLVVEGAAHAESYPTDSAAYEAKVKEFAGKFLS